MGELIRTELEPNRSTGPFIQLASAIESPFVMVGHPDQRVRSDESKLATDAHMAIGNRQEVYLDLKRRILTLELEPGSNLDETTISSEFGISRTPLRDIFRQLAGEGYISIVGNRGASVSSMNHKTLRDFFQTAPLVYSSISRLAIQNATTVQIESLKAAQDKFRQASLTNSVTDLVFFNERFHCILGEMADNQFLMPSLQRLLIDHARIAQTFYQKTNAEKGDRLRLAVDQHDQMIAAIEAGDEDRIVAVTLDHWDLSRSQMDLFVRPDPLPIETPGAP